ncbi:MAG: hypothetical protein H0S79_08025 [Anaerolineaceae bacterium]|nr:hypothetical protein [Anaerolineaceae bacterium]
MNSEKIKSYLKDFRITIPVGVVVGLILGLVIGWGIWPVQWTDLAPYHLREDLREDYLRMSIFTTSMTGDAGVANKAWIELGETAEDTLDALRNDPGYLTTEQIASYSILVNAANDTVVPTQGTESVATAEPEEEPTGKPNWALLGGLCVVLIAAAAVVIYFFVIRPRSYEGDQPETLKSKFGFGTGKESADSEFMDEGVGFDTPEEDVYAEPYQAEAAAPVAQFMTTFMVGDDLYDDSFSIDAPTGEFLGECGVGISDTVGVGEPKHVSALEVWLFDKNDIQTVTKVVMSEHVYEDNKIRMRLESKGEPILAEPGKQVLLETATLQLEARIVDMEYGEGAAPDRSFFQRLTLELSVWPKVRSNF